jgi:hypothetical protein
MSDSELSAAEFRALYDRVKHMSRWGPADRRGALNNISPTQVVAAASDIWRGRAVSLAAPIESEVAADNPDPAVHQMTRPGTGPGPASGLSFAMDRIAMNIHGNADSHIDALCHARAAMGLHLMDWLQFDDLVAVCEELNRWSFLCVVAPLRLHAATGSPVNPIAISEPAGRPPGRLGRSTAWTDITT